MENHTVHSYDKELNKLRNSVINMASLVKDLVSIANYAIQDPNKSFVELANSTDWKINHFDSEVESLATHVLALRQPMAIDLRQVISALKLAVILERMGDLAKKISHRMEHLPITLTPNLTKLIYATIKELERLLTDVIQAYENLDKKLAIKVSQQDHLIDDYYCQIMDLLENEIESNSKHAKSLLNIVLVARNFERIGDYISKIAHITHYIITGEKLLEKKKKHIEKS
jgi:phosphate transport system protein